MTVAELRKQLPRYSALVDWRQASEFARDVNSLASGVLDFLVDIAASQIANNSTVTGDTVKDALEQLASDIAASITGVSSVFGRVGAVVAASGDYTSTLITNSSGVAGATVTAALNALNAALFTNEMAQDAVGNILSSPFQDGGVDLYYDDATPDITAVVQDGAISVPKIADGTAGQLITWDAGGAPAVVAVGTATHVLTSNGAGLPPTFQAVSGGSGLTQPQVMARQAFGGF